VGQGRLAGRNLRTATDHLVSGVFLLRSNSVSGDGKQVSGRVSERTAVCV
jgi:hypothetical protein